MDILKYTTKRERERERNRQRMSSASQASFIEMQTNRIEKKTRNPIGVDDLAKENQWAEDAVDAIIPFCPLSFSFFAIFSTSHSDCILYCNTKATHSM